MAMLERGRNVEESGSGIRIFRRQESSEDMSDDDLIDFTESKAREGPRLITLPKRNPKLPPLWSEIEH